jgi:uncharacterized protein YdcH (DUF465 family)
LPEEETMPDPSVTQELCESDDEFSRLYEEHQDCERRLDTLRENASLSEEDELTAKQIKRHKLFLKDRMEEIARSRQETVTA